LVWASFGHGCKISNSGDPVDPDGGFASTNADSVGAISTVSTRRLICRALIPLPANMIGTYSKSPARGQGIIF